MEESLSSNFDNISMRTNGDDNNNDLFGCLTLKIIESKNMKQIEKISKANYQLSVIFNEEKNVIYKKVPITQQSTM